MSWHRGFAPYVPVAQRLARGKKQAAKRMGKGESLLPITISGSKIATTFWGQSWCTHLEKYSDYANRLPRGRTYARNGSIAHLKIAKGQITAMVCGSSLYSITIKISPLRPKTWSTICRECSTSIHSIIDLMRGKLGDDVIRRITDPKSGLFPTGNEIQLRCSCPDGAYLCKHLAATLYGVGHRLDTSPELLFLLRGVDQNELVSQAIAAENAASALGLDGDSQLVGEDLGAMFGIEMAEHVVPATKPERAVKQRASKKKVSKQKVARKATKKTVKKTALKKKVAKKRVTKRTVAVKPAVKKKASKKKGTTNKVTRKKKAKSVASDIVIRLN